MEEHKSGSGFRKGFIVGVLAAVLVIGLVGCAAYFTSFFGTRTDEGIAAKVTELEQYIDEYYLFDYEEEDVENCAYKGLMAGLGDVYTAYYTPEEYAEFMQSANGVYYGIGAELSQDRETGVITVMRVFDGSPAQKGGLEPGDVLYKVGEEEVTGQDLSLVVVDLKGEEGTSVDISVMRDGNELALTLVRERIEIPTVAYELLEDGIGYIEITAFEDVTDDQFLAAMDDLESQGMQKLIIDLRDNGGGMVDVTCTILDRLLPEGLIVYTEDKNGTRQEMTSDAENYFAGEMAVLVNGNSASASEIFAGAVKDYGVGTLIGTQTYGKGIVQNLIPLSDGSAIKITTSRYYTPAGNNIHEVGITPDIILEYDAESEEDNQLQKAIEVLKD